MAGQGARTLRPEDEISHYRIVGPLGAGGMGEVYLAQDQSLERNVALKILPPELVRSEERVRRFVLEAKSASSLSHPNIVTIYEIGQDSVRSAGESDPSPLHFISMELVSGKTLSTLIHEDKTDLRTLLGYLAQAADGLAKAHAAGIVHRDLKPGNIMVSADGFAKVLDFGLAKLTEQRDAGPQASTAPTRVADATGEGVVLGTAGYMSPEQVQGKAVDHRSDIFSFGCILYEAGARQRPFTAETGVETMHKILHDKPTPVEEMNPKAPAELRRLIRRCLTKSADQRLQSMKDLSLESREIVDEYETLSASASSGSLASGAAAAAAPRRTPVAVWVGAGVVAVAGIALAVWGLQRGRPQSQPFQNMRVTVQTSRGDVADGALSPDGRYFAYLAGRDGSMTLRVRQVATGSDVEILPTTDAQIRSPSFSPDGNYLFYTAVNPTRQNYLTLYQVPSLGGAPRERGFDVNSRVSFSPDGRQLAFWRYVPDSAESRLIVLDLGSEQERILATVPNVESFLGAPAWSPDGKRIAASLLRPAPDLQTTIALFDAATGQRQDFSKRALTILNSVAWLRDGTGLVSTGGELRSNISDQVFLHDYPDGRMSRITNDFNSYSAASASLADETIAAVRTTSISNVWIVEAAGDPPRRLTSAANPESSTLSGVPVDAGTILITRPEGSHIQLSTIPIAGGEARLLTTGDQHSVNGNAANGVVIFDRLDTSGVHIWSIAAGGGSPRRLTSGAGEQAMDLSPDGRLLIASHYDSPRKYSILSTEDGRVVLEKSDVSGILGFSPDSRSVMFGTSVKDAEGLFATLWNVLPIDGGAPTASFRFPAQVTGARWAPEGNGVTFSNRGDPAWNVYRMAFDGGEPAQVTRFTQGRVTSYQWSPDGRKLAVQLQEGAAANLWIVEADRSRPVQATQFGTEQIFGLEWTPDSRRVVLAAGTSTSDAVLIREFR